MSERRASVGRTVISTQDIDGRLGLSAGGRSSMAEQKLPKLTTGVRFSSPAPVPMATYTGVAFLARLAKSA